MDRPTTALLLIAHGSRHNEANEDLHHIAVQMRQRERYLAIEISFLELAEPTVEQGAARCVQAGAQRVVLLPFFLSAGVHVRRDLTAIRQLLQQRHSAVEFVLGEPLGRHPALVDAIAERALQAELRAGLFDSVSEQD